MGLKKYIFASILLVIAIFGYTFSIESGDYRIEILDYSLVLPVAVWVVAPTVFLFIMTVLHILFYGLKNYFSLKAVEKDTESMIKLIDKRLVNEDSKISFQNKNFKALSEIIKQLEIDVTNNNFHCDNKEMQTVVGQIFDIKAGKYISSKELKLSKDNPIMIENIKNRIQSDENFALEAVKKTSSYPKEVVKAALFKILETKSMTTIKKHIDEIEFDEDMVIALCKKDSEQNNEFSMTNDVILKLIKSVELTNSQLIQIAKAYKFSMAPDQLLSLYEDISSYNEEYTSSYLHVLAEYEMLDKMRDILVNSSTHEFTAFKALLDLKDAGKHIYSLDSLQIK